MTERSVVLGSPEPCPEQFNAARHALRCAARLADKPALVCATPDGARSIETFGAVEAAVRRAAGAFLSAGLARGARVLIRVGDNPQFPVAYFGAMAAGGVALPVSSQLSPAELSHIATDAQPALAVLSEDTPDFDLCGALRLSPALLSRGEAVDFVPTKREDPALLVYTSGSSGAPKGVLHAHRFAWARRMMHRGWHGIAEADRVLHAGAFNWTYTLGVGLLDPWSVGATAVVNTGDRAPERWADVIRAERPTVFAAVPGVFRRILKYGADDGAFASLRCALSAGEKLSDAIRREWQDRTGVPLVEALGMSECSTYLSASTLRPAPAGAAGWAQPGRALAILDECGDPVAPVTAGEIALHATEQGLMLGYLGGGLPLDGAWFRTGDRGAMAADGTVTYLGRTDDLMNAQGYRVSPLEVEAVIGSVDGVEDCAVIERAMGRGLSIIAAYIVGSEAAMAAAQAVSEQRLAAYKRPRSWGRVAALPRGRNGKLIRAALRDLP